MGTTLYLTRHGETKWNVEKRMQGWQDSPLTEKGRQDAKRLGKRLEAVELAAIYTSTSGRALETAELVRGGRLIPIYQDERLREIQLGDWEGKTHDEIRQMDPTGFDHFGTRPICTLQGEASGFATCSSGRLKRCGASSSGTREKRC